MRGKETIKISRLSTGYSGKHGVIRIATDIDASVYGGELTCLLGANGAGKSTLLRTLSASQPPLSGEVWIGEKRLAEYSDKELAKVVGIVLTERCEVENLTVEELVGMGRTPYTGFWGTLRKEDKQIVAEAISQVGISKLSHRMVQTLSDGERQKVMIAKALAQQTSIILLDEPTAFLDFSSKVEVMRLLFRQDRFPLYTRFGIGSSDSRQALVDECRWNCCRYSRRPFIKWYARSLFRSRRYRFRPAYRFVPHRI